MKILHLDIETGPNLVYTWGLFNQNISLGQLVKPGYTLCWAAKWHHKSKMMSAWHTDKHCWTALHALLTEADAICTYNGKRFDIPIINKEFLLAGLPRTPPVHQIDLYPVVKSRFRFASNKLDHVAKELGLGSKVVHRGFGLWVDCMNGSKKAQKEMLTYNKQDVALLGPLYDKLREWIPNVPVVSDGTTCPHCKGTHMQKRGSYKAATHTFQRYHCQDCGVWSRSRKIL